MESAFKFMNQPKFKLENAMVHYKKLMHQIHSLQFLDTVLANQKFMENATAIWRQDSSKISPIISLYSCAESWKDLPHQRQAMRLIDREIEANKIDLTKVVKLWRTEQPKELVELDVPYIYQLNLFRDPARMCNVASVAMVLAYREKLLGKPFTPSQLLDLPEILDIELAKAGRSRYTHANLDWLLEKRGVTNAFTIGASEKDIKAHLTKGFPVIYSGRFTRSGHIVVITGFNELAKNWIVNDPYGRFQSFGRFVNNDKVGIQVKYSYTTLEKLNDQPGKYWAHFPSW